ncbi:hypothetical protein SeMB42_g01485 [Synchytrium endobioticum]|uniref:Amino acid transporter transmembrane domain-containing protein n=1 Tax=Synchytrium endobioticum TaxID=286115 RepID=A0A507DL49_9FUNG|nr:hypothetical protein SeLEV6574_g01187 [Synchytrium endobioticum]TPX52353.1 hypothetical protein SeMB42_g01485 [Synchytrium endobioticum]
MDLDARQNHFLLPPPHDGRLTRSTSTTAPIHGPSEPSYPLTNLTAPDPANARSTFRLKRQSTMKKLLRHKTVGLLGGIALLVNSLAGPGLPQAASLFQQNGWLYPTIAFAVYAVLTSLCSMFVVEAMQSIPGNKHFQGTVEYGTLINFYFSDNFSHIIGQLFLYASLQSTAIASIITSAQTFDSVLIDIFHQTCGVSFTNGWICVSKTSSQTSPFGGEFMFFTSGLLVVLLLVWPLATINLDDSINFQIISFLLTIIIYVIWIIASCVQGLDVTRVRNFKASPSLGAVAGVVMLNYAVTSTIPSWVNVKKRQVNVATTVWSSVLISLFSYIGLGILPALAFNIDYGNLLTAMVTQGLLGRITGYLFSIVILVSSIPVFFFVSRANLVQNDLANPTMATFLSHLLPWICVIPFQTGTMLATFIAYTSLAFVSIANFSIPLLIYIRCRHFRKVYNNARQLTPRQRELLKKIHIASRAINRCLDIAQYEIQRPKPPLPYIPPPIGADRGSFEVLNDSNSECPAPPPVLTIDSPVEPTTATPLQNNSLLLPILPIENGEIERGSSFHGSFGDKSRLTAGVSNPLSPLQPRLSGDTASDTAASPIPDGPAALGGSPSSLPSTAWPRLALVKVATPSTHHAVPSSLLAPPLSGSFVDEADVVMAAIEHLIDEDVPDPEVERLTMGRPLGRPNHDTYGSTTAFNGLDTAAPENTIQTEPAEQPEGPNTLSRHLSTLIRPSRASSHEQLIDLASVSRNSLSGHATAAQPGCIDSTTHLLDGPGSIPASNFLAVSPGPAGRELSLAHSSASVGEKTSGEISIVSRTSNCCVGGGDMMRSNSGIPYKSGATLPMHPQFTTPAFATVPWWIPVRGLTVAIACLVISLATTFISLGYTIRTNVVDGAAYDA